MNAGAIQASKDYGDGLVIFSKHYWTCEQCSKYAEGRVYSLKKGGKFPYLYDLPGFKDGFDLLHPNCKHLLSVYTPELYTDEENRRIQELSNNHEDNRSSEMVEKYKKAQEKARKKRTKTNKLLIQNTEKRNNSNIKRVETAKVLSSDLKDYVYQSEIAKEFDESLKILNVEYNECQKYKQIPTDQEIIDKLGGPDKTVGSCTSLALAYVNNKGGYETLDFRGGECLHHFARLGSIKKIAQLPDVKSYIATDYNAYKSFDEVTKIIDKDKTYLSAIGRHTAITKIVDNEFYYLELQDKPERNGFKTGNLKTILKKRFKCQKSHTSHGLKIKQPAIMIDIDTLKTNKDFNKLMGYINTSKEKQKKGEGGSVK